MRFLDSNILAYAFYRNANTAKCQAALREGGVVDTLNLVEAFFIIENETGSREQARKSIRGLLKSTLHVVEVDINIVFEALKVVHHSRLSIFDAIHYACARTQNCDVILSYDKDFDQVTIPRREP